MLTFTAFLTFMKSALCPPLSSVLPLLGLTRSAARAYPRSKIFEDDMNVHTKPYDPLLLICLFILIQMVFNMPYFLSKIQVFVLNKGLDKYQSAERVFCTITRVLELA